MNQRELKALIAQNLTELTMLGLHVPSITTYRISNRMVRKLGHCMTAGNRWTGQVTRVEIAISGDLPLDIAKDTLMHEMLHAIDLNKDKHGGNWLRLAHLVNKTYGYHIQTKASAEESQALAPIRAERRAKAYTVSCTCGFTQGVTERHSIVKATNRSGYSCPHCKGRHLQVSAN